jgi:hypothetical protein
MGILTVGTIYRYSSTSDPSTPIIDGLPNLLHETHSPGLKKTLLESGINQIGTVKTVSGARVPAILISSSTHKQGSKMTPWQDEFDADNGYIRFFGDNKSIKDPSSAPGNRVILGQFLRHHSSDSYERLNAIPFIFFKSTAVDGRVKGNRIFQGIGLLNSAELVTQFQRDIGYFSNYVFEFDVIDLRREYELFNWDWISARRDPKVSSEESLVLAPKAWQEWVRDGDISRGRITRSIIRPRGVSKEDQLPTTGSREERCLADIYKFYASRKVQFELLASKVVANLLRESGNAYHEGWVTQGTGDGGIDFVGRIDLGTGFAKVEVIVLGQAKCESYAKPTNGVHLARTVSRLKRGWIGAYVTTSYFSDPSQAEITEDQYPLLMVNGLGLSKETLKLVELNGADSVIDFLETLSEDFHDHVKRRRPEEIYSH